jgi:hypothetical protein
MLALKEYSLLTFENVIQERIRTHLFEKVSPTSLFDTFPYSEKEIGNNATERTKFFLEQLGKPVIVQEDSIIGQNEIRTLGRTQNKQYELANSFEDAKIFDIKDSGVKLKNFEGYFIVRYQSPIIKEDIVTGTEFEENFDSGDVDKIDITETVSYRIDEYFLIQKSDAFSKGFNSLGKIGDVLVILGNASADATQQIENQNNTSQNFSKKFETAQTSNATSQYDFAYTNQGETLTLISSIKTNENKVSQLFKSFLKNIEQNRKYYQFAAYYIRKNGSVEGITPITSKPNSKALYVKEANQGLRELFAREFGDVAAIVSKGVSEKTSESIKNMTPKSVAGYPNSSSTVYGGAANVRIKKNEELQKTINNIDRNLITLINSIEVA